MNVYYSSKFLRSFIKLPPDVQDVFRVRDLIFRRDPSDPRLKIHKLKGRDEWSFLVTYKIRVIFLWEKDAVRLVNIGDHSIYRK